MTTSTLDPVPKPKMVMRSIRVPLKLWDAAKNRADAEESDISTVVRRLLETYVQGDK